MQPNHLADRYELPEARGPEACGTLVCLGGVLAAACCYDDHSSRAITPPRGLYAAVTRRGKTDRSSRLSRSEDHDGAGDFSVHTGSAPCAVRVEKEKGVLAPGMLADFVVLDRDLAAVALMKTETKVLRTVVGGKTVFEV